MKIRSGFVSNSSSASYTVIIDMELNEFVDTIYQEFDYSYFRVTDLIDQFNNMRVEYKKSLDKQNAETKPNIFHCYTQEHLDTIDRTIEKLNAIKDLDDFSYSSSDDEGEFVVDKVNAVVWLFKEIYSINLTQHTTKSIQLETETSMHNSYKDVPEIIRTILTYFDFEMPEVKKICIKDQ